MSVNKTKVFIFDRGGREVKVIGRHLARLIKAEGSKVKSIERPGALI